MICVDCKADTHGGACATINRDDGEFCYTASEGGYCHCPVCGIGSPRDPNRKEETSPKDDTSVRLVVDVSYPALGKEIGELVASKQQAYGDSFGRSGKVLEQLYPDGIPVAAYPDALAVIRVVDKLFRIATAKDAFGEDPWRDVTGYGLLGAARGKK